MAYDYLCLVLLKKIVERERSLNRKTFCSYGHEFGREEEMTVGKYRHGYWYIAHVFPIILEIR